MIMIKSDNCHIGDVYAHSEGDCNHGSRVGLPCVEEKEAKCHP